VVVVPLCALIGWRMTRTTPPALEDQPAVAEAPKVDPPAAAKSLAPAKLANTPAPSVGPTMVPVAPVPPSGVSVPPPSAGLPSIPVVPPIVPVAPPVTPASYAPVVPAGAAVPPPLPSVPPGGPLPTKPEPPVIPAAPPVEPKLPPPPLLPSSQSTVPPPPMDLLRDRLTDLTAPPAPPKGGIPGVPVPPPAIPQAPPVSKLKPLPNAPVGATMVYLNQTRVAVDYEVTKKGASGLGTVELWMKDANGWSRAATAKAGEPVEVDLPADGVYGTKVVPVSGQGIRGTEPAKDAEPDLWVIRDTTPPEVSFKVTPAISDHGIPSIPGDAPFMIELTAKDANLSCETLAVEWSEGDKPPATPLFTGKDLSKEKIETKLGVFVPRKLVPEKGEKEKGEKPAGLKVVLDWTPAPEVPARVNFTISVKDKAGNVGGAGQANLGTDMTAPAARVTGIRGVPEK